MNAKGSLTVVAHVKVPPAATDRIKAMRSRRWVNQTVQVAHIEECEHSEAASVVKLFRSRNPGVEITGQWTGRLEI